jgi:hypothetical protein
MKQGMTASACKPLEWEVPTLQSPRFFITRALEQVLTVQLDAEKCNAMQDSVAIKIFTDAAGFLNEERAYGIKAVVEAVGRAPTFIRNKDCSAMMPNGWPFPPFTIAEKGQSLEVWMQSYSADPITSMQV